MPVLQRRYIYYIVFEQTPSSTRSKNQNSSRSAIELALREKITSISHLEEVAEYITQNQNSDSKKSKARSVQTLIIYFKLMRTERHWFKK